MTHSAEPDAAPTPPFDVLGAPGPLGVDVDTEQVPDALRCPDLMPRW